MKQLNLFLMTFFCSILAIGAFSSCIDEEGPELKDSITLTVDLKDILAELKADNETAIKKLSDELQAIKEKQGASEEKITKLVNDLIDAAKGDLTKELGVLKASLKVVEDKAKLVDGILEKVSTIEGKVATLETAINETYKGKIERLEGAKKILEDKNKSQEHRLNRLEGLWANMTMEAVDLGLSVLWAPMNLGAANETRFGGYYAWGELTPKDNIKGEASDFTKENYKYYNNGQWTKYTTAWMTLESADDAANQTLGKGWRMPTKKEFEELVKSCTFEYKQNYKGGGTHGILVTSNKTKKSIFIPYGGYYGSAHAGETLNYDYTRVYLWSATSSGQDSKKDQCAIKFTYYDQIPQEQIATYQMAYPSGLNIRPVKAKPMAPRQ